jgi:uncharacterized protein (DUF169 family)
MRIPLGEGRKVSTISKDGGLSAMRQDFSIFKKFGFDKQPVGVKFLFKKPDGIEQLGKTLAFCEMLPEAQNRKPFYVTKENHECAGTFPLGMVDIEPFFASGLIGERLGAFEDARAGRRPYDVLPRLDRHTVNCVAFSPLDQLSFDPDLLIVTATIDQAEILLRASTYKSGRMWTSKTTSVLGCAWLYVYPYVSGELNYIVYGLCAGGMKAKKILPEGLVLLSIPFDQLPVVTENLKYMEWHPPEFTMTRDEASRFFDNIVQEAVRTIDR